MEIPIPQTTNVTESLLMEILNEMSELRVNVKDLGQRIKTIEDAVPVQLEAIKQKELYDMNRSLNALEQKLQMIDGAAPSIATAVERKAVPQISRSKQIKMKGKEVDASSSERKKEADSKTKKGYKAGDVPMKSGSKPTVYRYNKGTEVIVLTGNEKGMIARTFDETEKYINLQLVENKCFINRKPKNLKVVNIE